MVLTQRRLRHGIFAIMTVLPLLIVISAVATTDLSQGIGWMISLMIGCLTTLGLWLAYVRGWELARHALVVFLTFIIGLSLPEDAPMQLLVLPVLFPAVSALILTDAVWVVGSAIGVWGILLIRMGGQSVYNEPIVLFGYVAIVSGMAMSDVAFRNLQRVAERHAAEARVAQGQAEQHARDLVDQAERVQGQNQEQQRLLDLVASLETPTITLQEGVLLAPVVGTLTQARAQEVTQRLLEAVHKGRVRLVIIDIGGVVGVDEEVALRLMQTAQALKLLGCEVILTGITAEVAITLSYLKQEFKQIRTARSPQEALAQIDSLSGRNGVAQRCGRG
jgi:rsbT co-antagonist protein RsbR